MENDLNKILSEINKKGFFSFSNDTPDNLVKAKQRLVRLGLIKEKGNYSYDLTGEGQNAIDLGGYSEWERSKNAEKSKDTQIKDLTIKQLKGNIFQLKYWWLLLMLSGLIGFLSANLKIIKDWFR